MSSPHALLIPLSFVLSVVRGVLYKRANIDMLSFEKPHVWHSNVLLLNYRYFMDFSGHLASSCDLACLHKVKHSYYLLFDLFVSSSQQGYVAVGRQCLDKSSLKTTR